MTCVCARIIKESTLRDFAARHSEAAPGLEVWPQVIRLETFGHFADLRRCFRSADHVRVGSYSTVVVFNIHRTNYPLICPIHYNTGKVFLLRFLTHA
jgi:mRNA-degrading endonuclease HigB of HigAB toxin-antitoxin module